MPQPGHIRSDFLQLEEEVQRSGASEVGWLRQLEEKNARLKRVVADLTLAISLDTCSSHFFSQSLYM
jgi:hypothetical protein